MLLEINQQNIQSEMLLEESEIRMLIYSIYEKYGYDFSNYSKASIRRRLIRILDLLEFNNLKELQSWLLKSNENFERFLNEVTVNVTEMFRDPTFFKSLKERVFPYLKTFPYTKIWHAGCSTGEEMYSLAILLEEAKLLSKAQVYGTDINTNVIREAREGIYPLKEMADYSRNYVRAGGKESLSNYYLAKFDSAIFSSHIKQNLLFSYHNLVTDSSFNEFNLIVCRNVLIYFDRELQAKVFQLFLDSLPPLGYLALGSKESVLFDKQRDQFEVIDEKERIYRKNGL